jgi:hypothetical protein
VAAAAAAVGGGFVTREKAPDTPHTWPAAVSAAADGSVPPPRSGWGCGLPGPLFC